MNIRQLEYFIAVAETLNFTKAASRFYISQTAITQQIKVLEREINCTLFYRNKRHVELTPAGKVFLPSVREILRNLNTAIARCTSISTGITGTLIIGIVKDYVNVNFVDTLDRFCRVYPNISLHFIRQTVDTLYNLLLNNKVDIIINVKFHTEKYSNIQWKLLHRASLLAICSKNNSLANKTHLTVHELRQENLLLLDTQGNELDEKTQMLHNLALDTAISGTIYYNKDVETIFLMAAANQGIGLVPDYVPLLQQFSNKIRAIPIIDNEERVEVITAWNKENENPSLQWFLNILQISNITTTDK